MDNWQSLFDDAEMERLLKETEEWAKPLFAEMEAFANSPEYANLVQSMNEELDRFESAISEESRSIKNEKRVASKETENIDATQNQ